MTESNAVVFEGPCPRGAHGPDRAAEDFGVSWLACRECGREYPVTPQPVCELCFGPLEAVYDYGAIAAEISREEIASGPRSLWRYARLLPAPPVRVDTGTGFTPLRPAPRLAAELGLKRLWLKNDSQNPTNSFKDRVVSVAAGAALYFGYDTLACASTGNLANSVAAHAAAAGLRSVVFIPKDLESGKVAATAAFGGDVVAVDGTYDDVNRLCSELAAARRWAFVNVGFRAFYSEGSKTLAFEVAEQLGWRAPGAIVCPVASGSLLTKVSKGLKELHLTRLLDDAPATAVHGAQAEGCSPVAAAFDAGADEVQPVRPKTIARSLAIGDPADGYYALKTVRSTGGRVAAVPEPAVREGIDLLARTEGILTEPAGGTTVAALEQLVRSGAIGRNDETVALITGHGLKTLEVLGRKGATHFVQPSVESVREALGKESRTWPR